MRYCLSIIFFFQLSDAETHLDGGTLLISSCRTMTYIHSFSRDYYFLCLSTLSLYEQAIRIPQGKKREILDQGYGQNHLANKV